MQHLDDKELLRRCGTRQSEEALSILINRHLDLVYSSALRQVRDPHLAKDIAQSVFILLARKAPSLKSETILTGWLYRSTRFLASETIRTENRRRAREHAAMQPSTDPADDADHWREIEPLLDEALADLAEPDRDLILLRFFEKRSFREVGRSFDISEDAAQKRVTRALEKLRGFLAARGGTISTATLGTLLPAFGVQAAPSGLAGTILTATAPAALAATTTFGIQTIIETITMTKLKTTAIASVLAAAVSIPVARQHQALKEARQENQTLKSHLQQVAGAPNTELNLISASELARLRSEAAAAAQLRSELASLRQSSPVRTGSTEVPKDSPGPVNPTDRLNLGRELMAAGNYPEALQHFLWCWDHGDETPAFAGVRVSFLLNDLRELGKLYPPALDAMATRRDEVEQAIVDGRGDIKSVFNYGQLNEHLGNPGQTMSLFDQLPSGHPARAQLVDVALEQFVRERRYTDIVQDGNPEATFDNARFAYEHIMENQAHEQQVTSLRRRAVSHGATALEALSGAGQVNRAIALADSVLTLDPSPETRGQLLKHAERSGATEVIAYLHNVRIEPTTTAARNAQ